MSRPKTLIVGLGSAYGDDRAGLVVAQRLQSVVRNAEVRTAGSAGELLSWIEDYEVLHVIDGCRGAGEPGTIARFVWPSEAIGQWTFTGTHDLSLPAALQLAAECRQLPEKVAVWAIETQFDSDVESFLAPLSPLVAAAAEELLGRLMQELISQEASHA